MNVRSCQIGTPFSANKMYAPIGRGKLVKTREYRAWLDKNIPIIRDNLPAAERFPLIVEILVLGGFGFSSQSDIDNVCKPLIDALVGAGIVPDDNQRYIESVKARHLPGLTRSSEAITTISYEMPEEPTSEWEFPWLVEPVEPV